MNRIYETKLVWVSDLEDQIDNLKEEEEFLDAVGEHEAARETKEERKEVEELLKKVLKGEK